MRTKALVFLFHAFLLAYIGVIFYAPIRHRAGITPPGTVYTYQHRILEDYYFYLMVIRQGREGLLEYDQYTTEPTNPTAMHVFYLTLGQIGNMLRLNSVTMYYAGMISGLILFYVFSWLLASYMFPNVYKYVAMVIFFLASPFPDTKIMLYGTTIPVGTSWWTNMDPYSRLTQVPHHVMGQAMLLGAAYFLLRFFQTKKFTYALLAAGAVTVGVFVYSVPMMIFLLGVPLALIATFAKPVLRLFRNGSIAVAAKKQEKMLIGLALIAGVAVVSVFFVQKILASPGWPWSTFLSWEANWYNHKVEIYPYTIGLYLISFGILPLFLIPGFLTFLKKPAFPWLLVFFLFITPIVMYEITAHHLLLLPKIRFVHSAPYVFAGLIATAGIQSLVQGTRKKLIRKITAAVIAALFCATTYLGLQSYWMPEFEKYDVYYNTYIPRQYFAVIDYLNRNTPPFSNVFASYTIGVYLTSFTKNNVFVGHMVSTANFWTKYSQANSFFAHQMKPEDALAIFREQHISYVLGEEQGLGTYYKSILRPVYSVDDLTLYTPIYEGK